MSAEHGWLLDAARRLRPEPAATGSLTPSGELAAAWSQVAAWWRLTPQELATAVAMAHGLEAATLAQLDVSQGSLLPERLCRAQGLAPLWHDQGTLHIAVSDPRLTLEQLQPLRLAARRAIRLMVMSPEDIDTAQLRLFAHGREGSLAHDVRTIDLLSADEGVDAARVVQLAKAIFRAALDANASDVHLHPFVGGGAIRFRVDGRMRRISTLQAATLQALSRYLKAHAGLDPNPMRPQDGRLRLKYARRQIDVRLSILPAYDGDRIVCRLLDQSRNFSLQHCGFSAADQAALRRLILREAGVVLMTGPTGSGKTSTLYALLAELNTVDVNIMTVEDPVEYVLPGISQVQVDDKQGRSFADALRSILRQDPDIVLVGEIRDSETAHVATQAALTGHLVLSTLHTNDALGTLPRLLDLGIDPAILADALVGVVSQRLVRKLCVDCRAAPSAPFRPGEEEFHRITGQYPRYRAVGCTRCAMSGFRGRVPLVEMFETGPALRDAILAGEHSLQRLREALGNRHRSMSGSAKASILNGDTSPAEAQRAMGLAFWHELAEAHGVDSASLRDQLAEEVIAGRRLSILVASATDELAALVSQSVPYQVRPVSTLDAARAVLDQPSSGVMAVVVDAALVGEHKAQALADWVEHTGEGGSWAGMPLVVIGSGPTQHADLLIPAGVALLPRVDLSIDTLAETLNGLLSTRL